MTLFQAIVYAIIHGFTEFLPVSANAHHELIPYFLGWAPPAGAFDGALFLGSLLALLIYFRHDWASIFSSFLQVVIFRKRPMTLDERMPIFTAIAILPSVIVWYQMREAWPSIFTDPIWIAGGLAAFGLLLWVSDNSTRRNKGMFDWNWKDCLAVGLGQALMFLPGCGRMAGAMIGALFRGYNREPAAKFAFFIGLPLIAARAVLSLQGVEFGSSAPGTDLSWLVFIAAVVISMLAGLLAIGAFMNHVQRRGFGGYVGYRWVLAVGVIAIVWARSQGYLS